MGLSFRTGCASHDAVVVGEDDGSKSPNNNRFDVSSSADNKSEDIIPPQPTAPTMQWEEQPTLTLRRSIEGIEEAISNELSAALLLDRERY